MKIALDPYMLRQESLKEVCRKAADAGFEYIELSPRDDFIPFFVHPRADDARVTELKNALTETGVHLASILPLYRWSSPDEYERQNAVRYWKRAIQIAVDLDCSQMNSEFSGRPEQAAASEGQFWRSMEELLPIFEREGIALNLEPHPDDFVETNTGGVNLVRAINSPSVGYVFCTPHIYHLGGEIADMIREAAPVLRQVHIADVFDHNDSSGLRYIVNPPGSPARVHQHLDLGDGTVDWDAVFGSLAEVDFDGIITSCVFSEERRALDSVTHMWKSITSLADKHGLSYQ